MKPLYPILMALLGAALGVFFIYKGIDKHFISPCKVYGPDSTLPKDYMTLMNAFCSSGFTRVVGFVDVLSGLVVIFPKTRLPGDILLLPVITTIKLFHLLIDNRPVQLIETGVPLAATILIAMNNYKVWRSM